MLLRHSTSVILTRDNRDLERQVKHMLETLGVFVR